MRRSRARKRVRVRECALTVEILNCAVGIDLSMLQRDLLAFATKPTSLRPSERVSPYRRRIQPDRAEQLVLADILGLVDLLQLLDCARDVGEQRLIARVAVCPFSDLLGEIVETPVFCSSKRVSRRLTAIFRSRICWR